MGRTLGDGPCGSPSTSTRRCTTTGTSSSASAARRFGVDLPYEEQLDLGRSRACGPSSCALCIEETHGDDADRSPASRTRTPSRRSTAGTRPGTSSTSRATAPSAATTRPTRWLDSIGLHYDELYCSYDKVARCLEIGIELLVDDSPVNLAGAIEAGIAVATIRHPWNRDVCEEEDVICADGLAELARRLEPVLAGRHAPASHRRHDQPRKPVDRPTRDD